jgi:hypothetical protein
VQLTGQRPADAALMCAGAARGEAALPYMRAVRSRARRDMSAAASPRRHARCPAHLPLAGGESSSSARSRPSAAADRSQGRIRLEPGRVDLGRGRGLGARESGGSTVGREARPPLDGARALLAHGELPTWTAGLQAAHSNSYVVYAATDCIHMQGAGQRRVSSGGSIATASG